MLIQGNKKKIFLILFLLLLVAIYIRLTANRLTTNRTVGPEDAQCQITEKKFEVRGVSLSGVLEPGTTIDVWLNYYQCHQVKRGDLVLYKINPQIDPIIKIVKGIPGDNIRLEGRDGKFWNILVNDKALTVSQGEPYQINEKAADLIGLYIKDYHGVIPPKSYLLMGNMVSGSVDSTRFGLVDISDIIGRAVAD
ncbi:MAG: signal peptidase I [Candidatus Portnoybacteria bacterium RBG_13_40_8]|uniref:Signal peptidase I n=1 Tax=Candidatus Portnoybacteria bacterium RBG_13_40_8 TaxID=1801990 RepID=A0A1G2F275_9BACT|nr:MAG: signal peptidase I [Candidatus Portnoybacteria bacterium RBG_13_40_8]